MAGHFWAPTQEQIEEANVTKFRHFVNKRHSLDLKDYWDLHKWSTGTPEEINDFWTAVWDWSGIIGEKGEAPLFDATQPMYETKETMSRARVNWAENMLLSHHAARSTSRLALIACNEPDETATPENRLAGSFVRQLTFEELYQEVSKAVGTLRKLGVGPGDRVAAFICNNAESVIFLLATSAVGAIWSSSPPEFGTDAVLDRFTQLRPKVLLTVDRYRAAGKIHDVLGKLDVIVPRLQECGLEHVIMVGQLEKDRRMSRPLPSYTGVHVLSYPDCLSAPTQEIDFWRGSGNAPLWVLYSSGTTGAPKAIIHNQLGMIFAMKHAGHLHNIFRLDSDAQEVHLQATTTGWMMWNQMVNSLSLGMTIVLYEGSPILRTNKTILFDLVDKYKVTSLSISPRYLQILYSESLRPAKTHTLTHLTSIFSAGSPLTSEIYAYIRDDIKDVFIHNGSGGTDICGVCVGAIPVLPIRAGVIQGPYLGFAIEACGDDGYPVKEGLGDLVIGKPAPNMPLGFLGDDEKMSRFKNSYFNQYPSRCVWYHADYIEIESDGGIRMHGRSDGVLNPQGVRFGSSELYGILDQMKEHVADSIAVGQKTPDNDERVVLFIKPVPGKSVDAELVDQVRKEITRTLSRRHVPAKILECPDVPLTVTGKKLEVAVKKIINGAKPESLSKSGMANPELLEFFVNHPELQFSEETVKAAQSASKA